MNDGTNIIGMKKRKRIVLIVLSATLFAALAGTAGVAVYRHSASAQLAEAKSTCAQASDRLRVAQNKYDALLDGDEYKSAMKITARQVEDGKVVTALAEDSREKTPTLVACNVEDRATLERNAKLIDKNAAWYETHAKTIDTDVRNVVEARDAKTLKDMQAALGGKITDARKLYDASKDKVKDDKTRDALKKQLDAAGKLKDGKDTKQVKDAQTALDKAMKTVNDSMKAKTDADRKAAEEKARKEAEAQAAAQAQASAQAQQQAQQSYTPTYTVPQQSYTPQYTAPQQTTPQYTAPAQPAQPATPSKPNTGSGPISGGHGVGSASDCDAACRAPIQR